MYNVCTQCFVKNDNNFPEVSIIEAAGTSSFVIFKVHVFNTLYEMQDTGKDL